MPKYVEGVELTQEGMHAIFARMGYGNITSGSIYNGRPTINTLALNNQGFMPVLTGVGPHRDSGHWIMLIKGPGNQYYLFDPLGKASGEGYQNILAAQLPMGSTLSVIPNDSGLNMGLCGYWVASAGLRAHQTLNQHNPPTLLNLGQTITDEMRNELDHDGYRKITGWLRAVADEFPEGDPQLDGKALRENTEKDLKIEIPTLVLPGKDTSPKEISVKPTAPQDKSVPVWNGFSLYTDETVRTAAQYAYDNYLGKPYTGPVESAPANFGGQMVYRQHHGLSHTLRTMAYAELIVEEARKAKLRGETLGKFKDGRTIADVTPQELKKIMIAQAFFVTGRDDEESEKNYAKYHQQSRDAFLKYVKDNESTLIPDVFKDQEDVNFYAMVIEDKKKDWDSTPAHVLINQGHMVDLVRVKQPPESYLESYFKSMQRWIGTQATEAVFATQRQFFHATYEAVTGFDSDNKEPHLVTSGQFRYVIGEDGKPIREAPKMGQKEGNIKFFPPTYKLKGKERFEFGNAGLGRYVIGEDGQPIRNEPAKGEKQGTLAFFPSTYQLQGNERFMRVDEYLKLDEVQQRFPGIGKHLEGGMPGMNEMDYWNRLNSLNRARCENDVDFCLKQLQTAHDKAKIDPVKEAFQSSKEKGRRQPNVDEIAAARIIQQILANPDCIHDDHVLINGQKLEQQFFRDLLAKCEMAVVGSLLNDTDMGNIDTLMRHEKDTEFHSTNPEAVPVKIGEYWINDQNKYNSSGNITQKKHDLIFLMQNDAWYFSRVNAIAQNRDKGSTFKEVLITTLMTPLTSKALVDTSRAPAPKRLLRGLNFSEEYAQGLINQANAMIANTTERLFTDHSPEAFKQIKLNDLSKMSGRTNASTTTDMKLLTETWDSNVIFEMLDPDGLLHPKQVGRHGEGTESEFSIYLPEDVALVPIKVTLDEGKTKNGGNRYIFTFVAVKSPDFIPRHENGYAVEPFLRMQTAKLAEVKSSVEKAQRAPDLETIFNLQNEVEAVQYSHLSTGYKNFLKNTVGPVLENSLSGLMESDPVALSKALAAFPSDTQWSAFNFEEARQAKRQMDAIKQMVGNKVVLDALTQCQDAMEKQNIAGALDALKSIPSESTISREQREQIQSIRQDLESLQRAVVTPVVTDEKKVKERYDALIENTSKKITELETGKLPNLDAVKKGISNLSNLKQEVTVLRNEKIRMHVGTDKVDFSDIEKLEQQIQVMDTKLTDAYLLEVTKQISALENAKPKNQTELKTKIAAFLDRTADIETLRNDRIKKHGSSKDPLDLSDLDKLSGNLQRINQSIVSSLINTIRVSINQMEAKTFHMQEKEIQQNFELLTKLEKTLDKSKTSEKLREDIPKLNDLLVAKQKAYPQMVQLQLKSEVFVTQLREVCQANYDDLDKTRNARLRELDRLDREAGITRMVGNLLWGFTNKVGLTTDERLDIRTKQQSLARFRTELFNDKIDTDELISNLARKRPSELQEGLGISPDNAMDLYMVLTNLESKTTSPEKLEERMKAIDDISTKIGREPEHLKFVMVEEDESNKKTIGF
ncbi:TPA: T4SS effector NAD-dependent ubiquitin ligase SdeA [Legionella pneumophila subsp. pneumophila]|uniref:Septation initiation protein n=4 Tax=Legionella pneumophila TaxID=446 RepID=Q5WUT3_LEGPL|nr:T4SS effector NAD-dependent ubiquitin ligase SdeA [Legionella pneumophila]AOW51384.1 septation initiation protein [Legionella pneumophila subsp. pneumophila]AOW55016.1 septation initiation protein [Legionella pneumophila subsp. pneumophila]AOW59404.1 septation initiation protein [Legionella pneumophila subsp. pneumophila]AOW60408.1 septation initiation protein [Legionella pneumophila subsp. pneumophila]AOW64891.1 septation initiation protein [Legionella pneumophila subsp. pneumophila]